jgi:uncharacterized membrane-anchored protein YitT (DUF2179 family)/predicted metal-dependent HD superfamily phosphohydrolase
MQYSTVYSFIIAKLQAELSPIYTYHSVEHTIQVIENVAMLANYEGLAENDITILKTAALFHDTGFLSSRSEHETYSCKLAQKFLPQHNYTAEQINAICELIMATKWPQKPQNLLEKLICDADLFYLSTGHYENEASKLYLEQKKLGVIKTDREWEISQINFLRQHKFYSSYFTEEHKKNKQEQLTALEKKVSINAVEHKKFQVWEMAKDYVLMLVGVAFAGFALKGFMVPNHFFDGGITGISLLIHEIYHINLTLVIFLLNLPLIILSYFTVGKVFALRTVLCVALLGIALYFLPTFAMTNDKLLISIFGGVFLGIGIGLIMRAGAALDGIEVLALYTLKRSSLSITEIILALNIFIFGIAALRFGIETALYSILTYFAATRMIDYVVEGLQAYTGVTIISSKSEELKFQLVNKLGRGITVYKGERGFLPGSFEVSADCDIIFTVITRLEMRKLNVLVHEIDPKAFVFANTIKEASGGVIKRRAKH